MKKILLTLTAALAFGSLASFAQVEDKTETFTPVADTYVRTDGKSHGDEPTMEIKSGFYGLIGFDFSIPDGMKIKEATLTLVTERNKNGADVSLYVFDDNFAENVKYTDVENYITNALETNPLVTFIAKPKINKAIFDNGITDVENQTLAAWTNTLDLTSYFKSLAKSTKRVNFLLSQDNGNQIKFFTKENVGFSNANYPALTGTASEVSPKLTLVFTADATSSTEKISPIASTFVRNNAANNNYGNTQNMEIFWMNGDTEGSRGTQFYGLMSFNNLPNELSSSEYELTEASLRLVNYMVKGDRNMEIYEYPDQISQMDAKWSNTETGIASALKTNPIAEYEAKGQGGISMTDRGLSDDYKTADAWTNYIDLTQYLKNREDKSKFSILLSKRDAVTNNANSIRVFNTNAGDVTAYEYQQNSENKWEPTDKVICTFAAADLKPQLKLTFEKTGTTVSVETIGDDNSNAPVEYYNLQGVKVTNPEKGIYIMRQGTSVRKVVL